jgi:hypothetical protein
MTLVIFAIFNVVSTIFGTTPKTFSAPTTINCRQCLFSPTSIFTKCCATNVELFLPFAMAGKYLSNIRRNRRRKARRAKRRKERKRSVRTIHTPIWIQLLWNFCVYLYRWFATAFKVPAIKIDCKNPANYLHIKALFKQKVPLWIVGTEACTQFNNITDMNVFLCELCHAGGISQYFIHTFIDHEKDDCMYTEFMNFPCDDHRKAFQDINDKYKDARSSIAQINQSLLSCGLYKDPISVIQNYLALVDAKVIIASFKPKPASLDAFVEIVA